MDDYVHLRCANDCVYVFSRFREPVLEDDWRTSYPFLSLTPADVETGFRRLTDAYTDPDGRDLRNLWHLAFYTPHTLPADYGRAISELTAAVVREQFFGYKVYDPFWVEPLPDDSIPAERPQPEGTEARRHWLNEQLVRLSQWQDSSMGQFDEVGEDPATPELLRFAVAFLKTPAKLGTGLVSDIAEAGLLLTDEATREAFVESIVALYEDPDRLDAIIDRFWDQPGYEIVSDLFAFSGELIIPLFAAGRVARVAKGATTPETPAPRHVDGGGAPVENARDASQGVARSAPEDNATVPDEVVVPDNIKPVVTAEARVNGSVFNDVNQTARVGANVDQPTLIAERIAEKSAQSGKVLPNGNMGTAHAEVGAIQQAFDAGATAGADMTLTVTGKAVCGFCRGDVAAMAKQAELKSLTVYEEATGNTLYWQPGMKSLKKAK